MLKIIETSQQEKVEMYRKVDKEILIEMLIEANKHLTKLTPTVVRRLLGSQIINYKN